MNRLRARLIFMVLLAFYCGRSFAQTITVSPSEVNAYSQGATSVFLTFGGLINKRPAEATWCGDLISAAPDLGMKCDPLKIFGLLPQRYNQSRLSGTNAYTDIMSITPQVARRAYLDAARGSVSTFFYVRRFISTTGGPDEYVPVTIRLSGNGSRVPLSLTEVKLSWGVGKPVLFIKTGERLPQITAEIRYTGTGRLKGRWEIVKPGEALPEPRDLLTEGTLPIEERGTQKKYTELSRFNVYLPPSGKIVLPGPATWRLDESLDGLYLVLLRIEASDDKDADSDLASVGAGAGVVHSGAVAGFPMPTLRYYVGNSTHTPALSAATGAFAQLSPDDKALLPVDKPVVFNWSQIERAALYQLKVEDLQGNAVISAVLLRGAESYEAPKWLREKAKNRVLRWKIIAFDETARQIDESDWRSLRFSVEELRR